MSGAGVGRGEWKRLVKLGQTLLLFKNLKINLLLAVLHLRCCGALLKLQQTGTPSLAGVRGPLPGGGSSVSVHRL